MMKNPIDKDKVTDKPSTLEYAHTVGGAVIKPIDKGKVKGRALAAMEEQTHMQMSQIKQQIELLATQAKTLRDRVEISAKIYQAEVGFEPLISHRYFLYENKKGGWVLSMVAPEEWGRKSPYQFLARVKLLADHTWEVEESAEDLSV